MKKLAAILAVLTLFTLVGCSGEETEDKVIYISAIPDQNQTDLNEAMTELSKQLSDETGLNIEYKEVVDYSAVVNGFSRNEIQIAWFGGLTGVQARDMVVGSQAIAQRPKDEEFKSVFIANTNSDINSIEDFKGKSFTFGSESSTSGHLMPRYFLNETGITPEDDFTGEVGYSGSHDKTIELVENGTYDGGALNISVWEKYLEEGLVDTDKVKLVETTEPYYDYNFSIIDKNTFDEEYGSGSYDKIQEALLNIDIENNEALYKFFNDTKFIETKNENYDKIKQVAIDLGIIEDEN
ncbi:MAG: putative selenate ABC transporter substrate-binding protein [Bacilli bacterium]